MCFCRKWLRLAYVVFTFIYIEHFIDGWIAAEAIFAYARLTHSLLALKRNGSINSNVIALLIIIFITIFRTINRRYENPLILLTSSKKTWFHVFSEKLIFTWVHYKNDKNFQSKKELSGKFHSVSDRAEDGPSSYHKISIFDFLTKIDFFWGGGDLKNTSLVIIQTLLDKSWMTKFSKTHKLSSLTYKVTKRENKREKISLQLLFNCQRFNSCLPARFTKLKTSTRVFSKWTRVNHISK